MIFGHRTRTPILFFAFIAFVLCFTGCLTGLVPGENGKILQNLASEYYGIGQGYAELKKYDKAIEYYKLARRNAEFRKPADYQLARMYALSSKWADAEKAFKDLLRLDPDNTDLSASLAYISAQSGKLEEAEETYKTLVEKNPQNEQLLENYIRTLKANDKADDAAALLAVFTELFPDSKSLDSLKELIDDKATASETGESERTDATEAEPVVDTTESEPSPPAEAEL
jgi:tetratricopeptide (TPR) repeat protein